MTFRFAPLPTLDSPLRGFDPRWKLAALSTLLLATALVRTLPGVVVAFALGMLLAGVGRLTQRWFFLRMGLVAAFLLPFVLSLPFLVPEPGWVPSWRGIALAGRMLLQALTILSLVLVLLTSAPLMDLLKAAHCLYLPGLLVQLFLLTYRYVFLFAEEMVRLRIALRVRGFQNRSNVHSYRTLGQVMGTLLVRSHERSERVGQAMHCRGFDGRFRSLTTFSTRPGDILFWLVVSAASIGLVVWDLAIGGN